MSEENNNASATTNTAEESKVKLSDYMVESEDIIDAHFKATMARVDLSLAVLNQFRDELAAVDVQTKRLLRTMADQLSQFGNIAITKEEDLAAFCRSPYAVLPKQKNEFWVIVPRWWPMAIGFHHHSDEGYHYYVVNKYMKWLGDVPKEIMSKFRFREDLNLKVRDGKVIAGTEADRDKAWNRYREHLHMKEGKDAIRITKGHEFDLLTDIIADGMLPFDPIPVDPKDWRDDVHTGIVLRDYQQHVFDYFKDHGSIGCYWAYGAGKTILGIEIMAHLKGRKLVVVPRTALKEQWEARIKQFFPPAIQAEIQVVTYNSYEKVQNNEYTFVIFDEHHHLPANTFSRLATVRTKYRLGTTATPFREDGRENYIIALTGFPVGTDWNEIIKTGVIKIPRILVYIVRNEQEKIERVQKLIDESAESKIMIYSYFLELGERIAHKLGVPFVSGATTKDRISTLLEHDVVVASSVAGEGVSIPKLDMIIEVAGLFGSKREAGQLMGRLFHSQQKEKQTQHIVLMTDEELEKYEKRFMAYSEHGFRVEIVR